MASEKVVCLPSRPSNPNPAYPCLTLALALALALTLTLTLALALTLTLTLKLTRPARQAAVTLQDHLLRRSGL